MRQYYVKDRKLSGGVKNNGLVINKPLHEEDLQWSGVLGTVIIIEYAFFIQPE